MMKQSRATLRRRYKILVPLDGSTPSERALGLLYRVFRPSTVDVVLAQVVGPRHAGILVRGDDAAAYSSVLDQRDQAHRYLVRVRRRLARHSVRSRALVLTGDPVAEIARCARAERVDLILMSTHGRSGIRRALMGSVAESVLHHALVPILLVPAAARRR
jgi:nucleotide-binding universal stress UspA family protein